MLNKSRWGFTIIELLVVVGILGLLIAILLPTLSKVRRTGEMVRELAACKTLVLAYRMYAEDHQSRLMPGYSNQHAAYLKDGTRLRRPVSSRWPWRLAPWFDYQLSDTVLVNQREEQVEAQKLDVAEGEDEIQAIAYAVSVMPSFGLNTRYVGGHSDFEWMKRFNIPIQTILEPFQPDELIVFASARGTPLNPSVVVPGYHEVTIPIHKHYDDGETPNKFGFVHPRYSGQTVVGFIDGHAGLMSESEIADARFWSNDARKTGNPDWTPRDTIEAAKETAAEENAAKEGGK